MRDDRVMKQIARLVFVESRCSECGCPSADKLWHQSVFDNRKRYRNIETQWDKNKKVTRLSHFKVRISEFTI